MRSFRRAGLLALAASFSIHLLPLIGPHALDLLGPHLIREVSSGRNTEPLWLLTDVGTALALVSISPPQRRAKPLMTSVLVQNSRGEYSIMRIAGCETTSLPLSYPKVQPGGRVDFMLGLTYMAPQAGILFYTQETRTGIMKWNYLKNGATGPTPLELFAVLPILSDDGDRITGHRHGSRR